MIKRRVDHLVAKTLRRIASSLTLRTIITLATKEVWKESEVEELVRSSEQQGGVQSPESYARGLNACSKVKSLRLGRRLHVHIVKSGLEGSLFLGNHIVSMYARCGSPWEAHAVFERLTERNVFSWTAILSAYAQGGHSSEAMRLFRLMQLDGVKPDKVLFIILLESCGSFDELDHGVMIHNLAAESGLVSEVVVSNALINMYRKCGSPERAQATFDFMHERNIISWTSAIEAQSQNQCGRHALFLFRRMMFEGAKPNLITFAVAVEACDSPGFLPDGKLLHTLAVENGFDTDLIVGSILVHMYMLCKSPTDAWRTFESLKHKSLVTWSTMIQAYAEQGLGDEAFELYQRMQLEGVKPDGVSCLPLLDSCDRPEKLEDGKRLHKQLHEGGLDLSTSLQNAVVTMYGRCGDINAAEATFSQMQKPDEISWNALLAAYGQNGYSNQAVLVFRQLLLWGAKPSRVSFLTVLTFSDSLRAAEALHASIAEAGFEDNIAIQTGLISTYLRCNASLQARQVFNRIEEWNEPSCNAIMSGFAQHGQSEQAMKLLRSMMHRGLSLTDVTLVTALDTCANAAAFPDGRFIHSLIDEMESRLEKNVVLSNSLAHMYGSCGKLKEACQVFSLVANHDVVSWTSLIETFARQGQGKEALVYFHRMQQAGFKPNSVSFNCILSACSHAGLVSEGCQLLESMVKDHEMAASSVHLGGMVDLLGRAGQLELAEKVVRKITCEEESGRIAKLSLLGACRNQGDAERGERAAKSVLELDPSSQAGYVLLSHLKVSSVNRSI